MTFDIVLLVLGLIMLWGGAEMLVKYASLLARMLGVSPVVLGLTVVSLGTSIPELVVSSIAAIKGDIGISIGNIIGSNIANLGLILGVGALITPLDIKTSWVRREVPFMILVTLVFMLCAYTDLEISAAEGLILLAFLSVFLIYVARFTLKEMEEFKELQEDNGHVEKLSPRTVAKYLLLSLIGIAILIFGSNLAVDSGTHLAEVLGVSDTIIGLTLIAFGTSLPELATTVVSAKRKALDLAVGNVIGSNIFNLALIGGVTPLIRPIPIGEEAKLLSIEFPMLIFISLLIWPIMRIRFDIQRYEGILLLVVYCVFLFLTLV